MASERLAVDISRDLRAPGPWPSIRLLTEAADKLDGLIVLLVEAETARDDYAARLKATDRAYADAARERDSLARRCATRYEETEKLRYQLAEAEQRVEQARDGGCWITAGCQHPRHDPQSHPCGHRSPPSDGFDAFGNPCQSCNPGGTDDD